MCGYSLFNCFKTQKSSTVVTEPGQCRLSSVKIANTLSITMYFNYSTMKDFVLSLIALCLLGQVAMASDALFKLGGMPAPVSFLIWL